jgi:hypothetical protein
MPLCVEAAIGSGNACAGLRSLEETVDGRPFPFLAFRRELERRARAAFSAAGPDGDTPPTLYAEARAGQILEFGLPQDELEAPDLAAFAERLGGRGASKAGLLTVAECASEQCLALLVAASGRLEVVVALVEHRWYAAASLGPWSRPADGAAGALVEALRAAVARPCPDCGAAVGQAHAAGCDVERCSVCAGQRLLCACREHDRRAAAWSGEWPGLAECRARGWYARRGEGGWEPCAAEDEGAREDLNRLAFYEEQGFDGLYARA